MRELIIEQSYPFVYPSKICFFLFNRISNWKTSMSLPGFTCRLQTSALANVTWCVSILTERNNYTLTSAFYAVFLCFVLSVDIITSDSIVLGNNISANVKNYSARARVWTHECSIPFVLLLLNCLQIFTKTRWTLDLFISPFSKHKWLYTCNLIQIRSEISEIDDSRRHKFPKLG